MGLNMCENGLMTVVEIRDQVWFTVIGCGNKPSVLRRAGYALKRQNVLCNATCSKIKLDDGFTECLQKI